MTQLLERFLDDEHLASLRDVDHRSMLIDATSATYVLHQDVTYDYTAPITDVRQRLVIVPRRTHGDQERLFDHFAVDPASRGTVRARADRFGNAVIHVRAAEVERSIHFRARAVVRRTVGAHVHDPWSAPRPEPTRLTRDDDGIRDAAAGLRVGGDAVATAEAVSDLVHSSFAYGHDVTTVRTTAADAWHGRRGVCQDMAHVMISMCGVLGVAARYVSGHLVGDGASHAWVEVLDPVRGRSVAIDPTHNRHTDLRYLTTAVGRDYADVAPTTGTFVSAHAQGRLSVVKRIRIADVA
ncbi:MAG: transglutaminase protein [Ilumatobacteraceae bacterium]|nr:transglutaminase protein [Ilumatobacteraceae bacterium]